MAGGMTRGIIAHGIHGTVLIGIALIIGATTAGAGVDFTAAGILRGILTGIGVPHGDGVSVTDITGVIMAVITDITIIMITTGLIIVTSMDAHRTPVHVRRMDVMRAAAGRRELVRPLRREEALRLTEEVRPYEAVAATQGAVFQ